MEEQMPHVRDNTRTLARRQKMSHGRSGHNSGVRNRRLQDSRASGGLSGRCPAPARAALYRVIDVLGHAPPVAIRSMRRSWHRGVPAFQKAWSKPE